MGGFSLYQRKSSELWLMHNPEPLVDVLLTTRYSTYSMPVHTFINELHYQPSRNFSDLYIYNINTRNKYHLQRPNGNLPHFQKKYILGWHKNFQQLTT